MIKEIYEYLDKFHYLKINSKGLKCIERNINQCYEAIDFNNNIVIIEKLQPDQIESINYLIKQNNEKLSHN